MGSNPGRRGVQRLLFLALIVGIAVVVVTIVMIGVISALLQGSDLGTVVGGIVTLCAAAIALMLGLRIGGRDRKRADRMLQVQSSRVKEHRSEYTDPGGLLTTLIFDNDLVLQTGSPSVPTFFSAYFSDGEPPMPVSLSAIRKWHAGWGVFRRRMRHLERSLNPSVATEVESLRNRLRAKSARLDLYVVSDSRKADSTNPRGMVRLTFDPQDYQALPELVVSAIDSVLPVLLRAWRGLMAAPGLMRT